ncbi:MAG: amidohydrolase family protein [Rhodospirillales bacterium]|jgi:D-galactarolactone isomerase|nr:amidohydrolase family protein [Rhodospirillales bacterium]
MTFDASADTLRERRPRLVVPRNACDTHVHFFDRRFPEAATATKATPPDVWVDDYRAIQRRLGTTRVVVVQPTTYGLDNACQAEAAACFGDDACLVVVVDDSVTDDELRRLTALGARGTRFFMVSGGAVPWEAMAPVADRVARYGWHIELHLNGRDLPDRISLLHSLPVPVVIDHVGRFMDPVEIDHPSFIALLQLLETGRFWVKLSAPYVNSRSGPPRFSDVGVLARELARRFPERMVWASNWPHPGQPGHPDEADLLDLLVEWVDSEATRHRILVDNPAELYGFPVAAEVLVAGSVGDHE